MAVNRPLAVAALLAALAFAAGCGRKAAPAAPDPAPPGAREARIVEVLQYKFQQMKPMEPRLEAIRPSDIAGLEEATLVLKTPRGEQRQQLFLSRNDRVLFLQFEPVDASRPVSDLKAGQLEQGRRAAAGQPARGNPDGKVTIVEFSDFQCPYCKNAEREIAALLEKRGGEVKFVYRHFPLDFHPWARPAAIAAQCAAAQKPEAFWALHDAFFAQQETLSGRQSDIYRKYAAAAQSPDEAERRQAERKRQAEVAAMIADFSAAALARGGIDRARLRACAADGDSPDHQAARRDVEASSALGGKSGVDGTPGFLINGRFVSGVIPAADLERLVDEAIAGK